MVDIWNLSLGRLPKSEVKVFFIDAQVDSDLLNHRNFTLIAFFNDIEHFLHGLHFDNVVKEKLLLSLEGDHQAGFFFVFERPKKPESFAEFGLYFDGVQYFAATLGISELNDAQLHRILPVRRNNSSLVQSQIVVMYLLHDVIDEQIFLELLLEDEDFVFGLDAVVGIEAFNIEVFRQNT